MKKEKLYRLEFNERQQMFHYENGRHEPDTFGWKTVCDELPIEIITLLTEFISQRRKGKKHMLTFERILKYKEEYNAFICALEELDLAITEQVYRKTTNISKDEKPV